MHMNFLTFYSTLLLCLHYFFILAWNVYAV